MFIRTVSSSWVTFLPPPGLLDGNWLFLPLVEGATDGDHSECVAIHEDVDGASNGSIDGYTTVDNREA